jgi:hypothetical protein
MDRAPGTRRQAALRAALWLLLGCWLGAWFLFAFGVAPTAFRRLSPEVAGSLVGPLLTLLHLYGALSGVLLALLGRALRRPPWAVALPLLMSGLCLASHFGVTARIDEIRQLAFGAGGSLEVAERFARLHRLSMGIYTAVGLMALALLGLHAAADARQAQQAAPRTGLDPVG